MRRSSVFPLRTYVVLRIPYPVFENIGDVINEQFICVTQLRSLLKIFLYKHYYIYIFRRKSQAITRLNTITRHKIAPDALL